MKRTQITLTLTLALCLAVQSLLAISAFAQASAEGDWEGSLNAGAVSLRIVFHIDKEDNDRLSATLDSPDQNAYGIPVAATAFDGETLKLDVAAIQGTYEGKLNEAGDAFSGTWSQGGQTLPLEMKKIEKAKGSEN